VLVLPLKEAVQLIMLHVMVTVGGQVLLFLLVLVPFTSNAVRRTGSVAPDEGRVVLAASSSREVAGVGRRTAT
jgi:hypothetical protein